MVNLPVQVNGKKRAEILVAKDADESDRARRGAGARRRATRAGGQGGEEFILVPNRIVNIVA